MADVHEVVDELEEAVAATVSEVLDEVADEFAQALDGATELVAARFSVSRIAEMFTSRMPRIVRRLLGVSEQAATTAEEETGGDLPDEWEDLPGRYDNGTLPPAMSEYVDVTEHLLRAVGDRLAEAARDELAAGVDAGDDMEALRARLRDRFAREGSQLGEGREERVARTESGRAWNTATLGAAQEMTGPSRPLVKQWLTRRDDRVRHDHADVNGQLRLLDEPFTVGGVEMSAPHDPTAPASQVCNCRCLLAVAQDTRRAALEPVMQTAPDPVRAWGGWWHGNGLGGSPPGVGADPAATASGHAGEVVPVVAGEVVTAWAAGKQRGPATGAVVPGLGARVRHADEADPDVAVQAENREEMTPVVAASAGRAPDMNTPLVLQSRDPLQMRDGDAVPDLAGVVDLQARVFRERPVGERPGDVMSGDVGLVPLEPQSAPTAQTAPGPADTAALIGRSELGPEAGGVHFGNDELPPSGGQGDTVGHVDLQARSAIPRDGGDRRRGLPWSSSQAGRTTVGESEQRPVDSHAPFAPELSDPRPSWLEDMNVTLQRQLAAAGVPDADSYHLAWDDSPLPVLAADVTAAAVEHTGAMIALVPTEEDAERLALDEGELADELHLTLWFLGEGADWGEEQRRELIANVTAAAADLPTLAARAFGVNHWNPGSDSPSWVWAVGDDRDAPEGAPSLHDVQNLATRALEDGHNNPELPVQHSPWVPHICGAYDADPWPLDPMTDRVGPVTFDRIRIAFAGERTDIPLGTGNEEQSMPDNTAAAAATEVEAQAPPETRTWSTPDDTALAFEDMETGDGRLFTAGALSWDTGPWPLQYADEMLMGHQGAELAGAIDKAAREGQRITGSGVLYLTRPAGLDAVTLLEQEAPLGVSVDLDDVDVEFVDRTLSEEEDGWMFASARLPAASVLRMADGSLMLSAQTTPAWTASGGTFTRGRYDVQLMTGPSGTVSADAIRTALAGRGVLTAAAGDADDPEAGIVVHSENAGDFLMRITRARLRGATLVAMPAYADARIVLDPVDETAAAVPGPVVAAAGSTLDKIVTYVRTSPAAVGPRQVAKTLSISMTTARTYLNQAVEAGRLVRLAPGMYAGPCTSPEGPPSADGGDRVTAALDELSASAWRAMQDLPPLPAEWFREPTAEELPPGSGGVHYKSGRVFGWVAQRGEPHAGFPGKKLTIESLGKIDLSHFLRAKFATDDGGTVRAGSFTMNVPHNRDGAECKDEVCQFDDSRTVAGIVTVGMSKGGMWFSGAAAPWLSEWDRYVFNGCQPSYHMKQGSKGWELRAVLTVPVPGHSSPLVATAITERSNLALAASAAGILAATPDSPDTVSGQDPDSPDTMSGQSAVQASDQPGQGPDTVSGQLADIDVDALAAALVSGPFVDAVAAAVLDREAQRRAEIEAMKATVGLTPEEITASAAVTEAKGAS